jgi:hypothetical protein
MDVSLSVITVTGALTYLLVLTAAELRDLRQQSQD